MYVRNFMNHNIMMLQNSLQEPELMGFPGFRSPVPQAMALRCKQKDGTFIQGIFVNEALLDIADIYQRAIIVHEIGHIELGHLEKLDFDTPGRLIETDLEAELEADAFAARRGYGNWLLEVLCVFDMSGCLDRNLKARIDALYRLLGTEP